MELLELLSFPITTYNDENHNINFTKFTLHLEPMTSRTDTDLISFDVDVQWELTQCNMNFLASFHFEHNGILPSKGSPNKAMIQLAGRS